MSRTTRLGLVTIGLAVFALLHALTEGPAVGWTAAVFFIWPRPGRAAATPFPAAARRRGLALVEALFLQRYG